MLFTSLFLKHSMFSIEKAHQAYLPHNAMSVKLSLPSYNEPIVSTAHMLGTMAKSVSHTEF